MPNQDDLNRLDLGLPEFQSAPNSAASKDPQAEGPSHDDESVHAGMDSTVIEPATPEPSAAPAAGAKKTLNSGNASAASASKTPASKPSASASRAVPSGPAARGSDAPVAPAIESRSGGRRWWSEAPSWAVSMVVHTAVILALAAWNIEPIQHELKLMLSVGEPVGDDSSGLEEFAIDDAVAEIPSDSTDDMPADTPTIAPSTVDANVSVDLSGAIAAAGDVSIPSISNALVPSSGIAAQSSAAMRAAMNGRSKEAKREMLKKFGGTTETEAAVDNALKWLAMHQNPDTGAWTFAHPLICGGQCDRPGQRGPSVNAATGLALMCFLGAGQTHMEGEYKETVFKGLSFLIRNMRVQQAYGAWYRGNGDDGQDDMYAHGIASIAMCEAYGMTRDERLLEAAQLSINYMTYAQNPLTGGWHYSPFPLGHLPGDTSVVGWQMMAIKSAAMAGLNFDVDSVRRANVFLDTMLVPNGFGYHYSLEFKARNPVEYRPAMTACGVLCRMYSGWSKEEPTIKAAVAKFAADGPNAGDMYYSYYATQVLKQYGGAEWDTWNNKMRDMVLSAQVKDGHAKGSWFFENGHITEKGGRLYSTCMATMMLEVYYRYMPLYGEQAQDDSFQL